MHPKGIFIFIACFALISCHKGEQDVDCGDGTPAPISDFVKQFNFKPSSTWTYSNTSTGWIDTMRITKNDGVQIIAKPGEGHVQPCGASFENFSIDFSHHLFYKGKEAFPLIGRGTNLKFSEQGTIAVQDLAGVDSLHAGGATVLKEYKVFDETFKNVIVAPCNTSIVGFTRLWWCPGVGIIEAEFLNPATQYHEHWQLIDRKVELFQ